MSTKWVGRRGSFGIGKESSRGTVVSASYWEKQASLTLDERIEQAVDDSAFGTVEDAQNAFITNKWAEGSIQAMVKDTSFGLWLGALLGTDTPAAQSAPNATVYDHVFTVANSNQHPSLTVNWVDPIQSYQFANTMVSKMDIDLEIGKIASFKADFLGIAGTTASPTASYVAENYFLPQHGTFKLATAVSGLAGASATTIKKCNISIAQNVERDAVIGSVSPADFLNKHFEVSGSLEAYFQNEADFKTAFLADTSQAMLLDLQNTGVTLATSAHPRLQIQVSKLKFTDLARDLGVNNIVKQKIGFKGLYDTTTSSLLKVTLSDLVTTAFV
jgi:hypothetical protein